MDFREKYKVFCIFEGGGAKGIAHLGTMRAVEDRREFDVIGYAGTSAGAIIATLAAAGYKSNELYGIGTDRSDREVWTVLDNVDDESCNTFKKILGKNYYILKFFRHFYKKRKIYTFIGLFITVLIMISFIIHLAHAYNILFKDSIFIKAAEIFLYFSIFLFCAIGLAFFAFLKSFKGAGSLKRLSTCLELLLKKRLGDKYLSKNVTFQNLYDHTGMDLKIVATNLSTQSMTMFSKSRTPDVSISEAACASACIPGIFRPVKIGEEYFCDGGLVSNLPAWTIDDEVENEDLIVVTSELSPAFGSKRHSPNGGDLRSPDVYFDATRESETSGLSLLHRIATTSIFGGSSLNTRGLINHLNVKIDTSHIGTLEFDVPKPKLYSVVQNSEIMAQAACQSYLREILFSRELFYILVDRSAEDDHFYDCFDHCRVALVRGQSLEGSRPSAYHFWASCGFENHPDEGIVVPKWEFPFGGGGASDLVKGCVFSKLPLPLDPCVSGDGIARSRWHGARLPRDRTWGFYIPLTSCEALEDSIEDLQRTLRISDGIWIDGNGAPCEECKILEIVLESVHQALENVRV